MRVYYVGVGHKITAGETDRKPPPPEKAGVLSRPPVSATPRARSPFYFT